MNVSGSCSATNSPAMSADEDLSPRILNSKEEENDHAAPPEETADDSNLAQRPRKPWHAFNIFLHITRKRILAGEGDGPVSWDEIEVLPEPETKRRKHRKTPGMNGSRKLLRAVSSRWKKLDPTSKEMLQKRAQMERERYDKELQVWKQNLPPEQSNKKRKYVYKDNQDTGSEPKIDEMLLDNPDEKEEESVGGEKGDMEQVPYSASNPPDNHMGGMASDLVSCDFLESSFRGSGRNEEAQPAPPNSLNAILLQGHNLLLSRQSTILCEQESLLKQMDVLIQTMSQNGAAIPGGMVSLGGCRDPRHEDGTVVSCSVDPNQFYYTLPVSPYPCADDIPEKTTELLTHNHPYDSTLELEQESAMQPGASVAWGTVRAEDCQDCWPEESLVHGDCEGPKVCCAGPVSTQSYVDGTTQELSQPTMTNSPNETDNIVHLGEDHNPFDTASDPTPPGEDRTEDTSGTTALLSTARPYHKHHESDEESGMQIHSSSPPKADSPNIGANSVAGFVEDSNPYNTPIRPPSRAGGTIAEHPTLSRQSPTQPCFPTQRDDSHLLDQLEHAFVLPPSPASPLLECFGQGLVQHPALPCGNGMTEDVSDPTSLKNNECFLRDQFEHAPTQPASMPCSPNLVACQALTTLDQSPCCEDSRLPDDHGHASVQQTASPPRRDGTTKKLRNLTEYQSPAKPLYSSQLWTPFLPSSLHTPSPPKDNRSVVSFHDMSEDKASSTFHCTGFQEGELPASDALRQPSTDAPVWEYVRSVSCILGAQKDPSSATAVSYQPADDTELPHHSTPPGHVSAAVSREDSPTTTFKSDHMSLQSNTTEKSSVSANGATTNLEQSED